MALITMTQLPGHICGARLLAIVGGSLSSILGLTVLFGWYTHNPSLIQISAAFVPMQFNTALGFALSGLGLLLVIGEHRRAGIACAIFGMLLGLFTLGEYILGIDLGIDEFLMQHYITVETSSPGRMAPNTALAFAMTGAALIVLGTRVKYAPAAMIAAVLAALIFGLGCIAVMGYAASFEGSYGWGALTHMAIHTAGGFVILGVAVTGLAWHRDVSASSGAPAWFPASVGIAVVMLMISLWQAREIHEAQLTQQYGSIAGLPFVNTVLLVVGCVLATVLAGSIFLAQAARIRAREISHMNSWLAVEIDERKLVEKSLRSVSRQLRASIDQMPIAYLLWDDKFRITEWNPAAEKIFGYSKEEMLEHYPLDHIVPEPARARIKKLISNLMTGQESSYLSDENWVRKDGSEISVFWHTIPLQDETGSMAAVLSMGVDVTDRKRVEAERERLLHDIKERIKEITCLYGVAKSIQRRASLAEVFHDVAGLIPAGWHYSDITRGKIIFDGEEYVSESFDETEWKQSSDIIVSGEPRGSIEVYYLEERPHLDEGPFMVEERALIDGLSESLGRAIEHKQADEKLNKINRLYATLSQVNQAIVRTDDEQKLFQEICDVAIEFGKFKLAWIGLLDEATQLIQPVAFSGEGSDCIRPMEFSLNVDIGANEPLARSIRDGKSVVFNDLMANPDFLPWCAQLCDNKCRASALLPLRLHGDTVGTLNICAAESFFFDDAEVGLLEEMALDISFALAKFEEEKKHRQSDHALRQSDMLLNRSQEIGHIGSWELHLDAHRLTWSDEVYRLYGLQPQEFEVTYEAFLDFSHPHDRAAVAAAYSDSVRDGCDSFEFEHRIIRRDDGRIRVIYEKCEHVKDASGNIVRSVGMAQDVTARRHAEEAIRYKEQEQREILDSMLDAVITIDEAGDISSFNKTAETLFGYSSAEMIGQNVQRLMPEPYFGKHDSYLRSYLATGEARIIGYGREVEGQHKNKQTFPMRLSVAELPADDTGKRRFIGTCQDLRQIKQQEEQLRRTQKLDALGILTGGIAHDFNNMLGLVTGYAALLEDMLVEQPALANYAHEIHHAGERGAKLTRKLLSFSRKEAPEAGKLDINNLLQKQQDLLQTILTVRIELSIDLADEVWPIWLDNSDLEDAIVNMSLNAMHAMEGKESDARLVICTGNRSLDRLDAVMLGLQAGDYVQLSLADTGTGMDEATRERIFDPFFSTKGDKGTGLGLSQVFGFVRRAGGAIKVYSELGRGSNFVLYFPRYFDDDTVEVTETDEDVIDLRGEESILIVDDEAALLELTSVLLRQQGYRIFRAENGEQALQILEHEHIDLMLSDVVMPGMDGYQLAAIVQGKYPAVQIQMASGFAETWNLGVIDQGLRKDLLNKPYDSKVLFRNIRALLDK